MPLNLSLCDKVRSKKNPDAPTKDQLVKECKRLGLRHSGTKRDLCARLKAKSSSSKSSSSKSSSSKSSSSKSSSSKSSSSKPSSKSSSSNMMAEGSITIKPNRVTADGETAVFVHAAAGHLGIVKMLVKNGANLRHRSKYGKTVMHAAAAEGRANVVRYLATVIPDMVDVLDRPRYTSWGERDETVGTPLADAVLGRHLETVHALVILGAKVTKDILAYAREVDYRDGGKRMTRAMDEYFLYEPESSCMRIKGEY